MAGLCYLCVCDRDDAALFVSFHLQGFPTCCFDPQRRSLSFDEGGLLSAVEWEDRQKYLKYLIVQLAFQLFSALLLETSRVDEAFSEVCFLLRVRALIERVCKLDHTISFWFLVKSELFLHSILVIVSHKRHHFTSLTSNVSVSFAFGSNVFLGGDIGRRASEEAISYD